MTFVIRLICDVLFVVYVAVTIPVVILAVMLAAQAETFAGGVFGLAVLALIPTGVLLWSAIRLGARRHRMALRIGAVLLGLGCTGLGTCFVLAPDGQTEPGSPTGSFYFGEAQYQRASPANLVPEVDQLVLGSHVMARLDPFIDAQQGVRIRELFLDVYRDMATSPDFERLGSALDLNYRDIFLASRPQGHYYTYIPHGFDDKPLPVIVFLHGSLGNFKGYLWVWKQFADEHGFAILCPSFGAGNWRHAESRVVVDAVLDYCDDERFDRKRVYLAGISNGGTGVTRLAVERPESFKGLILISPIIEPAVTGQPAFLEAWTGRPVLILHGGKDRRIPLNYVVQAARSLATGDVDVSLTVFPEEDHFLLLSSRQEVFDHIAAWMEETN